MAPVLAALVLVGVPASSATGQARPPACPVAPDAIVQPVDLSDTDRLVRELRNGRREAAASCEALRFLSDAAAASASTTAGATSTLRTLGQGSGIATVAGSATAPAPDAQTVTLSDSDRSWLASTGTALRADVWVVVGLLGALFFGYFLIRRDA